MLTQTSDERDMFTEAQCLLVFGNWPLNQGGLSRGQMGRSILYRCLQRQCEPALRKCQGLEDVILSTMNLQRQAGLNSVGI